MGVEENFGKNNKIPPVLKQNSPQESTHTYLIVFFNSDFISL